MKKTLSLLKPYLKTVTLKKETSVFSPNFERIRYLKVPTLVDGNSLMEDVKLGAKQFKELDKLLNKENEPKYILITTDNMERAYMAVTYLAAGFNRKNGMEKDSDWDKELDAAELEIEEWEETDLKIPVISEHSLSSFSGGDDNPFSSFNIGSFNMQGQQNVVNNRPYWMDCNTESICIVASCFNSFDYNGTGLSEGLKYFQTNDKVYIIVEDCSCDSIDEEDDEIGDCFANGREKWNNLVLSFAMDECSVKLDKKEASPYFKALFQGFFKAKKLEVKKRFSYQRLVNMVLSMNEENKCQLVEKIITYAMKDWSKTKEYVITEKDFDFMNRFCRTEQCSDESESPKNTAERMMCELIGMQKVKEQVMSTVKVMKFNKMRRDMGLKEGSYHNVHIMLGAPGTAKTTIAKMMGQMMVEEKLLPDNRFICINGAELKGKYVGHSAPKTKAIFEQHDIIVIDEAYSLVEGNGNEDSFSREAIAQLIIELEEHSMNKLVIFAGYGGTKVTEKNNKMKEFLDANPGIKSRITSTIYFDSYSPEEMGEIFFKIADNQKYYIENPEITKQIVVSYFKGRVNDDNFGNGREARSLLETSVKFAAVRVFENKKQKYLKDDLQKITYDDVEKAIAQAQEAERIRHPYRINSRIGF